MKLTGELKAKAESAAAGGAPATSAAAPNSVESAKSLAKNYGINVDTDSFANTTESCEICGIIGSILEQLPQLADGIETVRIGDKTEATYDAGTGKTYITINGDSVTDTESAYAFSSVMTNMTATKRYPMGQINPKTKKTFRKRDTINTRKSYLNPPANRHGGRLTDLTHNAAIGAGMRITADESVEAYKNAFADYVLNGENASPASDYIINFVFKNI